MATANQVLDIARKELGYCRFDDPQKGTKYGRWYAQLVNSSYYGENGVPYCAMFASWVFYQAGQGAPGLPGAYCPWIVSAGKSAGRFMTAKSAQPGDLVLFDWEGDGVSDHIGIVEKNTGSALVCLEGNTTGADGRSGSVARRTRAYSTVVGVTRPQWFEPEPEPYTPVDVKTAEYIDTDVFQLWYIRGDIEDGAQVVIRNIGNWYLLSDPNSSTASGTPAQTWGGNPNYDRPDDPQIFTLHKSRNGCFTIAPKAAPHLRLDVRAASPDAGTDVWWYEANDTPAQDFFIYPYEGRYRLISAVGTKPLTVK